VRVGYQALFQTLFDGGRVHVPSLVEFLRVHGYQTLLLAPANRERPGLRKDNPYGYTHTLAYADLHYRGPDFGWGKVPDQYSLAYAHDAFLSASASPLFFMFVMVSSHAPWLHVPKRVDDAHAREPEAYERMARLNPAEAPAKGTPRSPFRNPVLRDLEFYSHELRMRNHEIVQPELRAGYGRSIAYDFELIRDELLGLHGDDLVIVMGDHQPPLVTREASDTAVPVHVLARDPALLREWLAHGFAPGLQLAPSAPAALRHEGLFSLIVRDLVGLGAPESALPPFLPHGVVVDE
jgi:hypothetical protein